LIDSQDLKRFLSFPAVFAQGVILEIEKAIDEYDDCKSYITRQLEYFGGDDGFKNPDTYTDVEMEIKWLGLPKPFEEKFLAVLYQMRKLYCGG